MALYLCLLPDTLQLGLVLCSVPDIAPCLLQGHCPVYSISTGAQYVTLDNKIKCLSLAAFFLATPPTKLELELHIDGDY
jgi:hypothetical protein